MTQARWAPSSDILTASDRAGLINSYSAETGNVFASLYPDSITAYVNGFDFMHKEPILVATRQLTDGSPLQVEERSTVNFALLNTLCPQVDYSTGLFSIYDGVIVAANDSMAVIGYEILILNRCSDWGSAYWPYCFTPDCTAVLCGEGLIDSCNIKTHYCIGDAVTKSLAEVRSSNFSPDGTKFLICYDDGLAEVERYPGFKHLKYLGGTDSAILHAFFSPDGNYILATGTDSTLRIWNYNSGTVAYTYPKFNRQLFAAGFSFDAKYVAATDSANSVIVWDAPPNLGVHDSPTAPEMELSQNAPNPVSTSTSFNFTLPYSEEVRIDLYDIMGRDVRTLTNGRFDQGTHSITISSEDISGLAPGVYYYRIEAASGTAVQRMVVQ